MKTQIIKIIPCLLAGFILSACVGAVNVPSEVADKVIKKTESEPIVLDPETILINRCIMDDNASDASCASAVMENSCITDPFGAACDLTFTDFYETARVNRISFCRAKNDANLCAGAIENVCDKNPFDGLCTNGFYTPRNQIITECRTDKTGSLCPQAIESVCGDNPFDMLCDESFETTRNNTITDCRSNVGGNFISFACSKAIENVCSDNPFDTLCNSRTYENIRIADCIMGKNADTPRCKGAFDVNSCVLKPFSAICSRETTARDARESFCRESGNFMNLLCVGAVSYFCGANPFDVLCVGKEIYFTAQKTACASESDSERCAPVVVRVCGVNILDGLCNGKATYFTAQKMACESEPNSASCAPIIAGLCAENPLDTLCQSVNLTLRDFPARPNNHFMSTSNNSPSGWCSSYCTARIPDVINIKPLNGTNTGMATYTGLISFSYFSYINHPISESIDIIVNFDNNTLSYSGMLAFSVFNINGSFTGRGQITGSVDFKNDNAPLIGLIGQNKAIGAFATEKRNSGPSGGFGGGFTATRQIPE